MALTEAPGEDDTNVATYTVVLNTAPAGNVTVTPVVSATAGVTVSPAALTFGTGTWSTEQTVTVTASQDDDAVDQDGEITHTVAGYAAGTVSPISVTVTDDDEQDAVFTGGPSYDEMEDTYSYTVTEGTDTSTYELALASAPHPSDAGGDGYDHCS